LIKKWLLTSKNKQEIPRFILMKKENIKEEKLELTFSH